MSDRPSAPGSPEPTPGEPRQPHGFGPLPGSPQQQGFGPPASSPQQQYGQQQYGQQQYPPQNPYAPVPTSGPDWGALAVQNERRSKRRRLLIIGASGIGVLCVAGAAAALPLSGHSRSGKAPLAGSSPRATASSSPSSPSSQPPSVGPSTSGSLAATTGSVQLSLGSSARVTQAPANSGQALSLPSGQDSFAMSANPVVDTSKSFTASIRVYSDAPSGDRVALSQGSGLFYSFWLGRVLSGTTNHWELKAQIVGGGSTSVLSKGAAANSQWTVLTAVYDAPAHQLQLYVNGALQGSVQVSGIAEFPGGLQLGRVRSDSEWVDPWHGDVADIQVWPQALTPSNVASIAAQPNGALLSRTSSAWLSG